MVIDEERQHDIYSYFREEAESDSLEDAITELGNEFEEEEIRLDEDQISVGDGKLSLPLSLWMRNKKQSREHKTDRLPGKEGTIS